MKKMNRRYLLVLVVGALIISCTKEEATVDETAQKFSSNTAVERYAVNPPYDSGEPGIDPSVVIKIPPDQEDPFSGPDYPFTRINTPTATYKHETCLLDISKLESGKTYQKIKDDKLAIGFAGRVLKLNSGPRGWDANWGSAPSVECERPDVLYMGESGNIFNVIYLSKPCIEFGFEMAPNHLDYDHHFGAAYGNWYYGFSEGWNQLSIRSPSGARLLAIKATKPFTVVTILLDDSPTGDLPSGGLAIANIRYRLAE
jgi:hypothetical protein